MLNQVVIKLRKLVLSQEDEWVLRIGKATHFTSNYLRFVNLESGEKNKVLGFAISQRFGICNMTLEVDGAALGWIENIQIDLQNGRAIVGHFAVAKDLTGLGLGKRLAISFGNFVKARYGVTHVLFDERKINSNPSYRVFFEKKLQATTVGAQQNEWLWKIP